MRSIGDGWMYESILRGSELVYQADQVYQEAEADMQLAGRKIVVAKNCHRPLREMIELVEQEYQAGARLRLAEATLQRTVIDELGRYLAEHSENEGGNPQ